MREVGVDVLLLSTGADLPYLTGYEAMPLERLTMLVVPVDGDAVDRVCSAAQRLDLLAVLDHAQWGHDVRGTHPLDVARQCRLQIEHEPRPRLIADADASCTADHPRHDRDGIVAVLPRDELEQLRPRRDARRLQSRNEEARVALPREDEHRQPLERHRLVPGEVRQVGAGREQQHVDTEHFHALTRPHHAFGVAHGCNPGSPSMLCRFFDCQYAVIPSSPFALAQLVKRSRSPT